MLIGQEITILGAGIAGLATATALAQRGAVVRVLERADAIREVGAGLQVTPNGAQVLRALGLSEALSEAAPRARAVVLRDFRRGSEVYRMALDHPARTYHLIHRADLIGMLRRAALDAGVQIELGQNVERVTPFADGCELALAGGGGLQTPVLIGADGIHSPTRRALFPGAKAQFTGQVAWRCTLPLDKPDTPAEPTVYMGPGCHLVTYPLRGGELMNIVAVQERDDWAAEGWSHRDSPANMQSAFADFCPEARDLLAMATEVYLWGLFRHQPAKTWSSGRALIIGDAAHPTLPFLAQGANMALEDAWVLADALAEEDSAEAAFLRFETLRKPRTGRVVEAAVKNAENYHLRPGPYRAMAHLALKTAAKFAPDLAAKPFDWIYGHDVTHGAGRIS